MGDRVPNVLADQHLPAAWRSNRFFYSKGGMNQTGVGYGLCA